jgi:hypothetical protein
MTQLVSSRSPQLTLPRRAFDLLGRAWAANKPLTLTGLVSLAFLGVALIGLALDPTQVLNEPAWLKPAKFGLSIAIYTFTFIWMLTFIRGWRRTVRAIAWVTAIAFLVEMAVIGLQAARGVRSHFNISTPVDSALFGIMGAFIFALWLAGLAAAILLIRQDLPDRAFGLSLKLGLLIGVLGAGIGALMTQPTDAQLEAAALTGIMSTAGAHSVGVPDGGAGLPVVGWSTEGGDLRVAHFLGLHAMQVVPLVAFIASRRTRPGPGGKRRLVWATAVAYAGLTALTLWQALRGQPLLQPDALTLGAAALLVAAVAAIVASAFRVDRASA